MFKKKLIALGLSTAMVCSFVACGDSSSGGTTSATPTTSATTSDAGSTDVGTDASSTSARADASDDHSAVSSDSIVDFEDGVVNFAVLNEASFTGDKDTEVSVQDNEFGSKVLYMTRPNGGQPAVAVDIVSLLGDNASKCASISVDVGVDCGDTFAALSGSVDVLLGESNTKLSTTYSIYKEDAIEKTVTIDLGGTALVSGNYLTFNDISDTSASNTTAIYIDNIIFYDADGNALPVDTSVEFAVDGVGSRDWSNGVVQPVDEVVVISPNSLQQNSWWPQNENAFSLAYENDTVAYYDGTFESGDVLTVYYSVADPDATDFSYQGYPYIRIQNWKAQDEDGNDLAEDGSGWDYGTIIDVDYSNDSALPMSLDDDSTPTEGCYINESFTIVQYSFDYIQAVFEANGITCDWTQYCDFFGIADRGAGINIEAITIGKAQ